MSEPQTNPDEYNGWVNRETWATALHLSNDQMLYEHCLELTNYGSREYTADAIKELVTEQVEMVLFPEPDEPLSPKLWRLMISDVGSFWRVDWQAVADSFLEE